MSTLDELKRIFRHPPAEFRSAPFWAWNDALEEEELVRQIRDMESHGVGGFFMHSREGLETGYMGGKWMNCVAASIAAAREKGMHAWLYDEDRWPSGAAGGKVPALGGDSFRAKSITLEIRPGLQPDIPDGDPGVIAVFSALRDGGRLTAFRKIDSGTAGPEPAGCGLPVTLIFRCEVSGPSEWFNDDAPADNLNPAAVRAFIDTTYEAYRELAGDEFGGTVKGIFTDEPNIADGNCAYTEGRGWIPWTDGFREYFRMKRGFDLIDRLPLIFFDGDGCAKIRHDYWRTVSERFCEAYSRQLGEWCQKNGLAFTGHYLVENDLGGSTRVTGAIMPHYRYQHVPGIDLLGEQNEEILTVKQCASVANQFGKKRVLSEFYACIGWELDFEGQKWVGDWQYALGVNLRCPHLALYSLRGCRKRDYPLSFNYHNSWWKHNHTLEDYFARIAAVMTRGNALRDVLVLHPRSSAWAMMGADPEKTGGWFDEENIRRVNEYGEDFNRFLKMLLGVHYDFDLGDETILAGDARVSGRKLVVGEAEYRAVVIPAAVTLFASTAALLGKFLDAGGITVAVRPLPAMIEGEESDVPAALFSHPNMYIADGKAQACVLLEKLLPRTVSLADEYGREERRLIYMLRRMLGCRLLFVVNTDRNEGCTADIRLPEPGRVEEWNLLTGGTARVDAKSRGGDVVFRAEFGPAGSALYVVEDGDAPPVPPLPSRTLAQSVAVIGPECRYYATMPNVLTLDRCRFRLPARDGTGEFSRETDIWRAQRDIRARLDMRQIYYNGLPQRYRWINEPHPQDGTPVELEIRFRVEQVPDGCVFLALEDAAVFTVSLNDQRVGSGPEGWFLDRSFEKIRLPRLQQGENRLLLARSYDNATELEDCYLVGDFAVGPGRIIEAKRETIRMGDWCLQGFPHYCGGIVYCGGFECHIGSGERILLELGDFKAAVVEVRVNGNTAGVIPWRAANRLDLTAYTRVGYNHIEIEVTGTPRNMLGPLHDATGNPRISWESFRTEGTAWTDGYTLKPYGLMEPARIVKEFSVY